MTFIRHSSRKPSQKHHVYYPQLEQQSQGRKKQIDQRKPNIDNFYISGFIHQEQNQVFTSKISRELRGKDDIVTSTRKEGHRTKLRRNDLTSLMKSSPYLHKKSPVARKDELKVRSRLIDQYFVTVRNEMEASIIIQLFWRRILALRRFHYMADRKRAAITVQATFRGFLARVRVKEYLKKMDLYVCLTQARLRRRLVTKRWNRSLDIMQSSAIFIQRNIRKFLVKCSLQNYAIDSAAMMIQMSYRTSVLRKKCYFRKRSSAAVEIQRVVRRIQAKQKVTLFKKELNEASRNIQRCWRGYKARKMRNEVLLHRCLTEFRNRIKVLDSKIDCFENQLEKFLTKSNPGKVQSDFDRSQQTVNRMKTQVESHERSIVELECSKSLSNPNQNDIDWGEEIEERIVQERQMKTSLQLDIMFNMRRNLNVYRRELDCINMKKQLFEDRINELRDERHALREILQCYQRQESKRCASINYRKAIADEKRKWKIVSIKPRGKSRKKCNDATPIIGSFSGSGNLDLDISNPQMKIIERIEHNLFAAETQVCSAMFEPLDKFQKYHL